MPDEDWHRTWLHAIESDWRVRSKALQVARVISDFAASRADGRARVSWRMLRRCTHQGNTTLSRSLSALQTAGWLDTEERKNGQKAVRRLLIPATAPASRSAPPSGARPLPMRERDRSSGRSANVRRQERHRRGGAQTETPTPTAPDFKTICGWCSRSGHTIENCEERKQIEQQ